MQLRVYNDDMVRQLRVMLLLASLCLLPFAAMGADIVVSADGDGDYRLIQRAIDAANYGDVILVNPGLYEESLVLISGITIRGSGPSHTIIRSNYGYRPVVQGLSVASVILEGLGLERGASMMESVVVDLLSSQIEFRDCHIAGGQEAGVRSIGSSALSLVACSIEESFGYGLQVADDSEVIIRDCRISDNKSVGLYLRDATADVEDTIFQGNEEDGITLEGTAILDCDGVTLSDNGRWGLSMHESSQASFVESTFGTHALGNIFVGDSASLLLETSYLDGGVEASIEGHGGASLRITDTRIEKAFGDGLRLRENSSLHLERVVVADCAGNGLSLHTAGGCQLLQATVAYNGGHGLDFRGDSISVTHSIFALNDGKGLSISASSGASQFVQFDYNNVWGNREGDYAGINRSSSDVSEAPEFANPDIGNFSLSKLSPCIGAGAFGSMVGASANPRWNGRTQVELNLIRMESMLGSVEAEMQWDTATSESIDGRLAWNYEWGFGRAKAVSYFAGFDRLRTLGSIEYSPSSAFELLGGNIAPTLGILGILDGKASRWQAWANANIEGNTGTLRIANSYEGPTGIIRQDIDLRSRNFFLYGSATNLTLTHLSVGWNSGVSLTSPSSTMDVELRLVPELHLMVSTFWHLQDGTIQFEAQSFLQQLDTSSLSLVWADGAFTQASVALRVRSGHFEDGEVRVGIRLANMEVTGSLGVNSEQGSRYKLKMMIDTNQWFLPRINQPPMPAYSHSPFEPEAGESIEFDASVSYDLDGELDQIWWDFGDGEAAIGTVVQHIFREPGDYAITLTVSDEDGAVTSLVEAFVVHEPQTTPMATFTWAAVSEGGSRLQRPLRAGDLILLDATDSHDPNGEIAEYSWDYQSDGVFDWTTTEPRIVVDPLPSGTWPVTLRVVDGDGNSDAVMRVMTIDELKPPDARFELSPATPAVGDPIRFRDTSISGDGMILSWEWDFGDGHTSREREPSHRYQDPDTYDVRLTVRDSEGLHDTTVLSVAIQLNPELVPIQQKWALVIGISDYAEVEDLSYARQDAEAIAAWLLGADVPVDHIRLLTDESADAQDEDALVIDTRPATLVNVREALGWLRQMAQPDDLVLIHFSGHGYQGADDNLDERDGVDEFFVLQDTRAAAKDDTALRDDEFGRFLDRIQSNHVLVFFDSCYSGGLSRSLTPGSRATGDIVDVFSDFKLEGRLILSASSESQDAFESPQLQHGVLTHFLLEGLDGAADLNADGHVTVWELFEYVRAEVPPFVQDERGEHQLPQLIGEGESRVVLTRSRIDEAPEFSYCPAIPFAGAETWFRSEADSELNPSSLVWDFGDGNTAVGQDAVHHYREPGTYVVGLSVQGDEESDQTTTQTIVVADWATIINRDDESNQVFISVGRQHGIVIGTRFSLSSASLEDEVNTAMVASLEVIELIDEDTAVCRILDSGAPLIVGSRLLPALNPDGPPCWETP